MAKAHEFQVVNISGFQVRGHRVSATFDVVVAPLNWTEAQGEAFEEIVNERFPELYCDTLRYDKSAGEGPVISPISVERMSFRWIGELAGPTPREKIEAEFAAQRQVVLTMLDIHLGKCTYE